MFLLIYQITWETLLLNHYIPKLQNRSFRPAASNKTDWATAVPKQLSDKNALNKTHRSNSVETAPDFSTIFTKGGVIHVNIHKAKLYTKGRIYFLGGHLETKPIKVRKLFLFTHINILQPVFPDTSLGFLLVSTVALCRRYPQQGV